MTSTRRWYGLSAMGALAMASADLSLGCVRDGGVFTSCALEGADQLGLAIAIYLFDRIVLSG